ncbi:MAG: menaquinone biosynthesis protein [Bryobacteraceae bacterium]
MNPNLPAAVARPSIAAVSYLNTVPLVWGLLHGPQQGAAEIGFSVPSECAARIASGSADLGIVPVVEMQRQGLVAVPGTGIACHGAVRSILLVSKKHPSWIRTVATDSGSRTSVALTQIILRERYKVAPEVFSMDPGLDAMLAEADAALLIGDAALRVDPDDLPYHVLDLGSEWLELTGLPMVFAMWSGRRDRVEAFGAARLAELFRGSLDYGMAHIDAAVETGAAERGFQLHLVRRYLTENIVFHIGEEEERGLRRFLSLAAELDNRVRSVQTASV